MHCIILTIGLISMAGATSNLSAQSTGADKQNRPSISVVNLISERYASVKLERDMVEQTALSSRAFVDLVSNVSLSQVGLDEGILFEDDKLTPEELLMIQDSVSSYLSRAKYGNQIVEFQFQVNDKFEWSNNLLFERSKYSQTLREARSTVNTERGALNAATSNNLQLESLVRAYVLVILPVAKKAENGAWSVEANSIMMKIDYENRDKVISELGSFYCVTNCESSRQKFASYTVPLVPISRNVGGIKTSTVAESLEELALIDGLLLKSLDLVVKETPELQLRTYITEAKPISALVGKKEGVLVGRRYRVVRQELTESEDISEKNVAFVRATKVSNNQTNAVTVDSISGKEVIVEHPPSNFIQVHGLFVNQRDLLVEDPDFGLLVKPNIGFGSFLSIGASVLYRIPNTWNLYAGVNIDATYLDKENASEFISDNVLPGADDVRGVAYGAGITGAIDLHIANGNMRLMPSITGFYTGVVFVSEDPILTEALKDVEVTTLGAKAAVDFSLQLKENVGLMAGLAYTYIPDVYTYKIGTFEGEGTDYSKYFSNTGVQLSLGVRIGF